MNPSAVVGPKSPLIFLAAHAVFTLGCNAIDDRPSQWEYLSPAIFQPNCATSGCHSRATAVSGLDFSDSDRGFTSLMGLGVWIVKPDGTVDEGCHLLNQTVVCPRDRRPLVTPYDPAQSRVVNMLRARGAPRMPPDRPLSKADIELVERWILNGAQKTANSAVPLDASAANDGGGTADASQANDGGVVEVGASDADRSDSSGDGDATPDGGLDTSGAAADAPSGQ
jgi:hypothetical protein